jgi:uncharacterized protein
MISLQKILGKDEKFFELLEGSAEAARTSAQALVELVQQIEQGKVAEAIDMCVLHRRKDKRITEEITELLCKTFVTPLEREDIEELSHALSRIPKTVNKVADRLLIAPELIVGSEWPKSQVAILEQSTAVIVEMVKELRRNTNLEKIRDLNTRLQQLEGKADKLLLDFLREAYRNQHGQKEAVLMMSICDLMEKAVDRCRDAGNVVFQIVLKNS